MQLSKYNLNPKYLHGLVSINMSRINFSSFWTHYKPFPRHTANNNYLTVFREGCGLRLFLYRRTMLKKYRVIYWNAKNVILTAMSLLHTTEWDNESQSCTMRSKPAVRNWPTVGWGHSAHSSSVCPMTAGLKPIDREPIRMQLRVDPTSNCDPRPSDTVRIPPRCSATYVKKKPIQYENKIQILYQIHVLIHLHFYDFLLNLTN